MVEQIYERDKRDPAAIRSTLRLACALSLLVHLTVLWLWPQLRPPPVDGAGPGRAGSPLAVRLAPAPSPSAAAPSAPAQEAQAPAKPRLRPPALSRKAPAAPPMVSVAPRVPDVPAPTAPPPPPVATPPMATDLSSYIEARRRARGESPPDNASTTPAEDDNERTQRIVAANLGASVNTVFGHDPKNGGGIFQIRHLGYDDAEFYFFGWNKDVRRDTKQLIEVRKGDNGDIRIAVVRKIIAIIREHESGDFTWVSERSERSVTLSARPGDNAALEAYMMREFFPDERARY